MGGKSAVRDHVSVCDDVRIAAKAGVLSSITRDEALRAGFTFAGYPARAARAWRRSVVQERCREQSRDE